MFYLRQADKRGRTQTDWLDSRHTFSFGQYYDPRFMAFSDLRVINDDVVAPSGGFGTHPHDNMEIVSVVFAGRLEHKDSLGSGSVITLGEVQAMTPVPAFITANSILRRKNPFIFCKSGSCLICRDWNLLTGSRSSRRKR